MKKFILLLFIAFLANYKANANNISGNILPIFKIFSDTNYVYTYPKSFLISPFFALRSFSIKLIPSTGRTVTFIPNMSNAYGVNLAYSNFRIQLATKFPDTQRSIEDKVRSRYTDLNLQMFKRTFILELSYKSISGFIDKDYQKATPTAPEVFANRDLRTRYIKLNYYHLFSPDKFSLRAAYRLMERQKRSAGSWLLGGNITFLSIGAPRPFIEPELRPTFEDYGDTRTMQVFGLGALGGYAHTFVYKDFFFTGLLGGGLELKRGNYEINNETKTEGFATFVFDARAVLGYNHKNWFAGINAQIESNQFRMGNTKGFAYYETVGFFVGRRIEKDKIFRKKKKDVASVETK